MEPDSGEDRDHHHPPRQPNLDSPPPSSSTITSIPQTSSSVPLGSSTSPSSSSSSSSSSMPPSATSTPSYLPPPSSPMVHPPSTLAPSTPQAFEVVKISVTDAVQCVRPPSIVSLTLPPPPYYPTHKWSHIHLHSTFLSSSIDFFGWRCFFFFHLPLPFLNETPWVQSEKGKSKKKNEKKSQKDPPVNGAWLCVLF